MASEASGFAGSLTSAAGALYQGQAQSGALDRAAAVERNNASLDIATGNVNAGRLEASAGKAIGQTTASFGAAGVTSDSGSVMNVLAASAANMELDRQNILHGAQVRAINYNNQATMDEIGAKSALQGSYMNALSSIAMGGSKVFGQSSGVSPGSYSPTTGQGTGADAGEDGSEEGYDGSAAAGGEAVEGGGAEELAFV